MRQLLNLLLRNQRNGGGLRAAGSDVFIDGPIVTDDFEAEFFGGVSLGQFRNALAQIGGDVHLRINSPGGDVFAARAMSQMMREHGGDVVAHVDGVAASAASLLVVAASRAVMAPGSLLMIHKAWTMTAGDARDHVEAAGLLEKVDGQIAASYAAKGASDAEAYLRMMAAETWFTPEEAVAEGLADEALTDGPKKARAWDLSAYKAAPYRAVVEEPEPPVKDAPSLDPQPAPDADRLIEAARRRRLAAAALL